MVLGISERNNGKPIFNSDCCSDEEAHDSGDDQYTKDGNAFMFPRFVAKTSPCSIEVTQVNMARRHRNTARIHEITRGPF
jgi:hypothetical protein